MEQYLKTMCLANQIVSLVWPEANLLNNFVSTSDV